MSALERREFLGSLLGFASVGGFAGASPLVQATALRSFSPDSVLVVYRAELPASAAFAETWAEAGCATHALMADPVRQWRDGLARSFREHACLLVGLGSWDDQIVLQGLAGEQRRHALLTMQHPLRVQQADWSRTHAQELLALLQSGSAARQEHALQSLARRSSLQPGTPSLFSWVIG